MKPVVLASWEDPNGLVCVDILEMRGGNFGYLPCRRDPEDGQGWRPMAARAEGFATRAAAEAAARLAFPACAP